MDRNTPLTVQVHAGGGHTHQGGQGRVDLTPEGQRIVDYARSRSDEENAAIIKGYGLPWTFTGMDAARFGQLNPNNPARFDPHTGKFYIHGEDPSDPGVQLDIDPALLWDKGTSGHHHGGHGNQTTS